MTIRICGDRGALLLDTILSFFCVLALHVPETLKEQLNYKASLNSALIDNQQQDPDRKKTTKILKTRQQEKLILQTYYAK